MLAANNYKCLHAGYNGIYTTLYLIHYSHMLYLHLTLYLDIILTFCIVNRQDQTFNCDIEAGSEILERLVIIYHSLYHIYHYISSLIRSENFY